jgi:transcriptional regulator with XRE-family HTH domain
MSGGKDFTVGERIRHKRKALGLSQEELAERMNVTAALISNYENDKVDIRSSVMRELAGILGTTVAYLMDGDPEIDTDIRNLIHIYLTLGRPNVQKVAMEQMKILNGV